MCIKDSLTQIKTFLLKTPYFTYHNETRVITSMISKFAANKDIAILDVGCGHGRNIEALKAEGFTHILGVDKNPETVVLNQSKGHKCCLPSDIKPDATFDVIIMSHIIEHFIPQDLITFMENYLDHLEKWGFLVIATPMIEAPKFYSDVDHVKAYYPLSLLRIFGSVKGEVQYYGRNSIHYKDIFVHRAPVNLFYNHFLFCLKLNWFQKVIDAFLKILFYMSRGLIGQNIGWVGIFQKT